ncbi:MAG: hypothetical protein KDA61_09185, partial [Planctomycetales bacterium]|nr:hypothetical protein [Planctomycetales bacterium]
MIDLWELALSNSLGAALLGLAAGIATWLRRSPQVAHALWLLALLKLVAPPLAVFQVASFVAAPESAPSEPAVVRQASDLPGALQFVPIETYLDEIESLLESAPATSLSDAAATAELPPLPANDSSQAREELSDLELAQHVPPPVESNQASVHLAVSWRTGLLVAWACGSCAYLVLVAL